MQNKLIQEACVSHLYKYSSLYIFVSMHFKNSHPIWLVTIKYSISSFCKALCQSLVSERHRGGKLFCTADGLCHLPTVPVTCPVLSHLSTVPWSTVLCHLLTVQPIVLRHSSAVLCTVTQHGPVTLTNSDPKPKPNSWANMSHKTVVNTME